MMQGFFIALVLACVYSEQVRATTIAVIVLYVLYSIFAALDQQ